MIQFGAVIESPVIIGKGVYIGYNTVVESHVQIGSHVRIFHLCNITKGAIIEDDVFIGPGVIMLNTRHISHGRNREHTGKWEPPVIKRGARIGGNCTIFPGIVIGEECEIGAGSVVTRDTEPYKRYWGNPAVCHGEVRKEERL